MNIAASNGINQKFSWNVFGTPVPILLADLSGVLRDAGGNVVMELDNSSFSVTDVEKGEFRMDIPDPPEDASGVQVYGQLPGFNKTLIFKGSLTW